MDKIIQIRIDRRINDGEMIIIHNFIKDLLVGDKEPTIKSREGLDEVLCPQ